MREGDCMTWCFYRRSSLEMSIARSYSTSSISEYLVELGLWTSSVYSIAPPTMNFTVSSPDYTGLRENATSSLT
ncbi:hypothetical protein J6590_085677 [Homalodisca vitripennis]|nr:hypothetical protein J6590_085677 [Homalodisca vitripennis]